MTLKEEFMQEMKIAMQEKDALKKNVVTMVRAAIKQYEVDNRVELDDNGVTDIIVKEVKKRRDSLPEYEKSGRQELIDQLNYELNYLSKYLPEQLSEDEVRKLVDEAVVESGATSPREMGKVMAILMPKTKGKADGKLVSDLVKERLS